VEEDAHGVHADGFSPGQLTVVGGGVEGIGLPHFELVDGVGGQVICSHRPGLLSVPSICLGFGPALPGGLSLKGWNEDEQQRHRKKTAGGLEEE